MSIELSNLNKSKKRAGLLITQDKMFVLMRQSGLKLSQIASQMLLKVSKLDQTFQNRHQSPSQVSKTLKITKLPKCQKQSRYYLMILVLRLLLTHSEKDLKMLLRLAWFLRSERDSCPRMRYL